MESLYPEYYLIKINRFNGIAKDTLDEWIYFLKNEEIKEHFTAQGLKEAQEKLSLMKLPEDEQKAYEHYKDDLHYQASMFESSFGNGYKEGKAIGEERGKLRGKANANKRMVLKMVKKEYSIETISEVTGLSEAEIRLILK